MKKVFLYSMKGCPHCANLKNKLTKEGLEFQEKDIDLYKDEYEKLIVQETNNEYLPAMLLLEVQKVGEEIIPEVSTLTPDDDFESIDEATEKIRSFLN